MCARFALEHICIPVSLWLSCQVVFYHRRLCVIFGLHHLNALAYKLHFMHVGQARSYVQNRFRLWLRPRPRWRSLQCSPRPPSWI